MYTRQVVYYDHLHLVAEAQREQYFYFFDMGARFKAGVWVLTQFCILNYDVCLWNLHSSLAHSVVFLLSRAGSIVVLKNSLHIEHVCFITLGPGEVEPFFLCKDRALRFLCQITKIKQVVF